MRLNEQRGDTLVEVLLATAILAFLVSATAAIMSMGLASAQLSLERTQVQAAVAGQASILRALRDAAIGDDGSDNQSVSEVLWSEVTAYAVDGTGSIAEQRQQAVCTLPPVSMNDRFYFDNTGSDVVGWLSPQPDDDNNNVQEILPQDTNGESIFLPEPGDGLWVEAYYYNTGALRYYDFYIKACWQPSGNQQLQELKTVVRLYANL